MSSAHFSIDATLAPEQWTELASRESYGVAVSLLWSKAADRVKVTVSDTKLDDEFEIDIANAEALAAFYHPFAYAAARGTCFGVAARDSFDLQPQS